MKIVMLRSCENIDGIGHRHNLKPLTSFCVAIGFGGSNVCVMALELNHYLESVGVYEFCEASFCIA